MSWVPRRERWADLVDTSNESLQDSPKPGPPLTADESYCSQAGEVDNPQQGGSSLTQRMRQGASLESSPSKEFSSFVKSLVAPDQACEGGESRFGLSSGSSIGTALRPSSASWQPNVAAVEFVPALHANGSGPAAAAALAPPADLSFHMQDVQPQPYASESGGVRRRITRKRPTFMNSGDGKRPRADSKTTSASAASLVQPGVYLEACASSASATATPPISQSDAQVQEVSEEDWVRRLQKRRNAVASTKLTPEYLEFASMRARGQRPLQAESEDAALSSPRTPEPDDRTVSKRRWEELVRTWRAGLRRWAGDVAEP
jgi:hypothetical protein